MSNPREIAKQAANPDAAQVPTVLERNRRTTRRRIVPKLMRVAGRVPFADDLAAAYYCALDPATPRKAKAVIFAALAYFVLPADAIPDVIAGFGFTDDATVLATALGVVGAQIRERHKRAARRLLGLPEP
ncbi:MAG: YkvA family protein, partial [Pseudomonadota bacterium]